ELDAESLAPRNGVGTMRRPDRVHRAEDATQSAAMQALRVLAVNDEHPVLRGLRGFTEERVNIPCHTQSDLTGEFSLPQPLFSGYNAPLSALQPSGNQPVAGVSLS